VPSIDQLHEEVVDLRAKQAALRARLELSGEQDPYLILDLARRELRLELQGVTLVRHPVREIALSRRARRISTDTTRIAFCETPFTLERDRWYERARTLALKDSTVIGSRPDTTGRLAERIVRSRILALLDFDRDLVVAAHGTRPPHNLFDHFAASLRSIWLLFTSGSGEGWRLWKRGKDVFIELRMEPAAVRSLAPNVSAGTRLIVLF
jgi:hypothetical protein